MNPRLFFTVLIGLAVSGLIALAVYHGGTPGSTNAEGKFTGGPFSLITPEGKRVTEKDFRGKYMLLAFGYTYCPDICPSELQTIANTLDALGPKADAIVPVFITVDPERDTPAQLGRFVKNFSPRIVGLTGTPEEIKNAAAGYRGTVYRKEPSTSPGDYAMTHSTFIYVIDPQGIYVTHFVYGVTMEEMTGKLQEILGK
jgi:cytochrome oxidase Cu insertion factor (SCO1/SenC/PrrC family)